MKVNDFNAVTTGLVDISARGVPELSELEFVRALTHKTMRKKLLAGYGIGPSLNRAAQFQIFPSTLQSQGSKRFDKSGEPTGIVQERGTLIRERQANSSVAGPHAADFHKRHDPRQAFPVPKNCITRLIAIGFGQHIRPPRGVKTGGIIKRCEPLVPVRFRSRIDGFPTHGAVKLLPA